MAPLLIQGVLALLAGVLVTSLPDTLPDTMEEAMAGPETLGTLHRSQESLDISYGKCGQFVLVARLIVNKERAGEGGIPASVGAKRISRNLLLTRNTWHYVSFFFSCCIKIYWGSKL